MVGNHGHVAPWDTCRFPNRRPQPSGFILFNTPHLANRLGLKTQCLPIHYVCFYLFAAYHLLAAETRVPSLLRDAELSKRHHLHHHAPVHGPGAQYMQHRMDAYKTPIVHDAARLLSNSRARRDSPSKFRNSLTITPPATPEKPPLVTSHHHRAAIPTPPSKEQVLQNSMGFMSYHAMSFGMFHGRVPPMHGPMDPMFLSQLAPPVPGHFPGMPHFPAPPLMQASQASDFAMNYRKLLQQHGALLGNPPHKLYAEGAHVPRMAFPLPPVLPQPETHIGAFQPVTPKRRHGDVWDRSIKELTPESKMRKLDDGYPMKRQKYDTNGNVWARSLTESTLLSPVKPGRTPEVVEIAHPQSYPHTEFPSDAPHLSPVSEHGVSPSDIENLPLNLAMSSPGLELKKNRPMPPRFQCDACKKSYSTFNGLSKHKEFHCTSHIKKEFTCQHCDKTYTSMGALKMHIRTHTLPCKCHICGKAFSRPWLLQGHVRTHTGEKPFQCTHCGRSFADRSNLRAHLQTHSDVKKYSCKNCAKTFSRMSLLVKHQENSCAGCLR